MHKHIKSKGHKRSQHKELENKVDGKGNGYKIISDEIECKTLINTEENEVKMDVGMEKKSPIPKKHGKHFCKKCAISFAT